MTGGAAAPRAKATLPCPSYEQNLGVVHNSLKPAGLVRVLGRIPEEQQGHDQHKADE
jgi:hypothetical protein